jgi:hypothetical protein
MPARHSARRTATPPRAIKEYLVMLIGAQLQSFTPLLIDLANSNRITSGGIHIGPPRDDGRGHVICEYSISLSLPPQQVEFITSVVRSVLRDPDGGNQVDYKDDNSEWGQ